MSNDDALIKALAPTGRLRAALNFGNKVLVQRNAETGAITGITPALAKELGKRLGLDVDFVPHERAEEVFDSATKGLWDVCFLASDPSRAKEIGFTAAYVSIGGIFVVPEGSSIRSNEDADQPGVRIVVSQGSAYDLFLTRTIKNAELVRIKDSNAMTDQLVGGSVDVAAGIQQPMEAFVASTPGYRTLSEPFMEITQAMGTVGSRPAEVVEHLKRFVEDVKASGFVRGVLDANGQTDVAVARPAPLA